MRGVAQRDEEFREYVLRRRPELVRTATLLAAGDPHLGEDLVQIALTRLYVAWPRVRAETRDAYLHRTLVHALIDDRRQRARRPETSTETLPERPLPNVRTVQSATRSGRRSQHCRRACRPPSSCATGWASTSSRPRPPRSTARPGLSRARPPAAWTSCAPTSPRTCRHDARRLRMTDLEAMLDDAAGAPATRPTPMSRPMSPRSARAAQGRTTFAAAGALTVALAAGLAVAVSGGGTTEATPAPTVATATTAQATFVTYTGAQPEGFRVATVPSGWRIQGVNEYALLIVPPGNDRPGNDVELSTFVGKLVVMLESMDATGAPAGTPIRVGDRDGVVPSRAMVTGRSTGRTPTASGSSCRGRSMPAGETARWPTSPPASRCSPRRRRRAADGPSLRRALGKA